MVVGKSTGKKDPNYLLIPELSPFCYYYRVIITKKQPFTQAQIEKLSEEFETYIKTVIDVEMKICSAGAHLHFDNEQLLLKQGSSQSNLWGGGIDLKTKACDFNAVINLRPQDSNSSNEILSPKIRQEFEDLMTYFFKVLWIK